MLYLAHFGLQQAPFTLTPNPSFFFPGAKRGATLDALHYALLHGEGIIKLTAPVGCGKTMLSRMLLSRLPAQLECVYIANPSLSPTQLLQTIALDLGLTLDLPAGLCIKALQQALITRYAAGKRVVVVIDEAHAMPVESLEEIRLLSNLETETHKLLQIVLFGQPELDLLLDSASLLPLRERIAHQFTLMPLTRDEVRDFIQFRLRVAGYHGAPVFSSLALLYLSLAANGLSRRVNLLADKALLAAFAESRSLVHHQQVWAAIRDSRLQADFYKAVWGNLRRYVLGFLLLLFGLQVTYGYIWIKHLFY